MKTRLDALEQAIEATGAALSTASIEGDLCFKDALEGALRELKRAMEWA